MDIDKILNKIENLKKFNKEDNKKDYSEHKESRNKTLHSFKLFRKNIFNALDGKILKLGALYFINKFNNNLVEIPDNYNDLSDNEKREVISKVLNSIEKEELEMLKTFKEYKEYLDKLKKQNKINDSYYNEKLNESNKILFDYHINHNKDDIQRFNSIVSHEFFNKKDENNKNKVKTKIKEIHKIKEFKRNKNLPINNDNYEQKIIEKVKNNNLVIITAETGAGKSTQVPQFLADAGYKVIVTQPRRLAARSLAERVAQERNGELGIEVGYQTGEGKLLSKNSNIIFSTDGLQEILELTQTKEGKKQILVLDEVHEWNIHMEVLVAWAKKKLKIDPNFKIVLMSATLDSTKLYDYFNNGVDSIKDEKEHIIEVPGRTFPVEEFVIGENFENKIDTIKKLILQKKNVLVFEPGKKEINETVTALENLNLPSIILPLHGELDPADQKLVFNHYPNSKVVVSTNIAQTSVTIDDIDAVVDSAKERRIELIDNVETLKLADISKADCLQRKGRAGRTKNGEYYLNSNVLLEDRIEYAIPEIQRVRLDQTVLRLYVSGIDPLALEFYHQPQKYLLEKARKSLIELGALTEENNVTRLGYEMSRYPVDVHLARMLVEAKHHNVYNEVSKIVSILAVGGILHHKNTKWRELVDENKEYESDLLLYLDIFEKLKDVKKANFKEYGIFTKKYFKAKEVYQKLRTYNYYKYKNKQENNKNTDNILKSIIAGQINNLYKYCNCYDGNYTNGDDYRNLDNKSVVNNIDHTFVVADKFNLEIENRRGYKMILKLLNNISVVKVDWIRELAPQLLNKENLKTIWHYDTASVKYKYDLYFKDKLNLGEFIDDVEFNDRNFEIFLKSFVNADFYVNNQEVLNNLKEILLKNKEIEDQYNIYKIKNNALSDFKDLLLNYYSDILYKHKITSLSSVIELINKNKIKIDDFELDINDFINNDEKETLDIKYPDNIFYKNTKINIIYERLLMFGLTANIKLDYETALDIFDNEQEFIDVLKNNILDKITYKFIVKYKGDKFSAYNITELKQKIEEYKRNYLWSKFKETHEDQQISVDNNYNIFELYFDQLNIDKIEEYDENYYAYPVVKLYTDLFIIRWERNDNLDKKEIEKLINEEKKTLINHILDIYINKSEKYLNMVDIYKYDLVELNKIKEDLLNRIEKIKNTKLFDKDILLEIEKDFQNYYDLITEYSKNAEEREDNIEQNIVDIILDNNYIKQHFNIDQLKEFFDEYLIFESAYYEEGFYLDEDYLFKDFNFFNQYKNQLNDYYVKEDRYLKILTKFNHNIDNKTLFLVYTLENDENYVLLLKYIDEEKDIIHKEQNKEKENINKEDLSVLNNNESVFASLLNKALNAKENNSNNEKIKKEELKKESTEITKNNKTENNNKKNFELLSEDWSKYTENELLEFYEDKEKQLNQLRTEYNNLDELIEKYESIDKNLQKIEENISELQFKKDLNTIKSKKEKLKNEIQILKTQKKEMREFKKYLKKLLSEEFIYKYRKLKLDINDIETVLNNI